MLRRRWARQAPDRRGCRVCVCDARAHTRTHRTRARLLRRRRARARARGCPDSGCAARAADDANVRSKFVRTARPPALGARIAARRQRQANHAEVRQAEAEEEEEADQAMSMLPQGLHNAMSEMSRAFAAQVRPLAGRTRGMLCV